MFSQFQAEHGCGSELERLGWETNFMMTEEVSLGISPVKRSKLAGNLMLLTTLNVLNSLQRCRSGCRNTRELFHTSARTKSSQCYLVTELKSHKKLCDVAAQQCVKSNYANLRYDTSETRAS
jgi:hypothetical protein